MTCASCAARIEKVIQKQTRIIHAAVNLATETASVTFYPDLITEKDIINKIKDIGYDAEVRKDKENNDVKYQELKKMERKLIISVILSIPLLITMLDHLFGITLPSILMNPWFQFVLATPVQFVIGWQFYKGADRKSTRLNSSHVAISYAVFCLKKKTS